MTINTELAKQAMVQPYYVGTKNDDIYIKMFLIYYLMKKSYKTILGYLLKTLSMYVYL